MYAYALLQLVLALLRDTAASDERAPLFIRKCCDAYEMLTGNASCVKAPWTHKSSVQIDENGFVYAPTDHEWVARWLPSGISLQDHDILQVNRDHSFTFTHGVAVNKSYQWDEHQILNKDIFERRVIFWKTDYIIRPTTQSGVRIISNYCVDAVLSPFGFFGLLFSTYCLSDDCAMKCCAEGNVLVKKHGKWECAENDQSQFSPRHSSFAEDFDPETPEGANLNCSYLWFATPEDRAAHWKHYRNVDRQFATWIPCLDLYVNDSILEEGLFYCEHPRLARGMFWIIRPMCVISAFVLGLSLVSIACDKNMRRKLHGWCLASHASCLFAFNVGQIVYFATIIDTIEMETARSIPYNLNYICKPFALWMYFHLIAAWFWLTALCANMVLSFRIQSPHQKRNSRKRFLAFSACAWGFPAMLTTTCFFLFNPTSAQIKYLGILTSQWYTPTLMEARVCYNEQTIVDDSNNPQSTLKYGTFLFYYGPVVCLVLCNIVCLTLTLKKVQYLTRGNSILRREEDQSCRNPVINDIAREGDNNWTNQNRNERSRFGAVDAKTIKLYIKMLLMTGGIELISEIICWVTLKFPVESSFHRYDYDLPYRTTGYVVDLSRAMCVAWLAAPEGGYWGSIRLWLRGDKKTNSANIF